MKDYKISFGMTTGRQLLDTVRRIAEFGESYARSFDGARHESAATYADLRLGALDDPAYGSRG